MMINFRRERRKPLSKIIQIFQPMSIYVKKQTNICHFLSFLNIEMVLVIEILYRRRQDPITLQIKYQEC